MLHSNCFTLRIPHVGQVSLRLLSLVPTAILHTSTGGLKVVKVVSEEGFECTKVDASELILEGVGHPVAKLDDGVLEEAPLETTSQRRH
jgi:hypothetical protein